MEGTSTHDPQAVDQYINDWQEGKNLGACIWELYDRKLWTDVKFRCKDHDEEERIHAHKIVLAARSPVFQAMFYSESVSHKDVIDLPDVEKKIFDLFLRYVYSDTTALEEGTAVDVLRLAQVYEVSSLVEFCLDYLSTIVTLKNACRTLNIALLYSSTILQDACCSYIDQNSEKILNSEWFLELSEDALMYVLKGDTFYANEESIFTKVEDWAVKKIEESGLEPNGENIRKTLGEAFFI